MLVVVAAWLALAWHRALPIVFEVPSLLVQAILPLVPLLFALVLRLNIPKWRALLIAGLVALPLTQQLIGKTNIENPGQSLVSLHLKKISQSIISRTGWSWDVARGRIFLVGVQYETDLGEIYRLEYDRWKTRGGRAPGSNEPDGFLVTVREFGASTADLKLSGIGLEPRMEAEIARGGIELKPLASVTTVDLLEYRVRSSDFPKHFHNLGLGYYPSALEEKYARHPAQGPETEQLGAGEFIARWNDCLGKERYCASAVRIKVAPSKNGLMKLNLLVLGRPLSVPSQWILPDFTQSLKDMSVEVDCKNEVQRKMLPSRIGFFSVEAGRLKSYVLGPLEYSFEFSCKGGPGKIKIAWPSSTVIQRIRTGDIPGHEFVFDIGNLADAKLGNESRTQKGML